MAKQTENETQRERTGRYTIPSLNRACDVLEFLAESSERYSPVEIARQLAIPYNTVYRIVDTLERRGYLERDKGNRVVLGTRLFALGNAAHVNLGMNAAAVPHMAKFTEATKESSILGVLVGHQALLVEQVESPLPLRIAGQVGALYPAHAVVFGQILLAHLPTDQLDAVLSESGLEKLTGYTITGPGEFKVFLESICDRGIGIDWKGYDPGTACIGVPVRNRRGEVVAAFAAHGPTTRLTRARLEEIEPLVRQTGRDISTSLGCPSVLLNGSK